MNWQYNSVILVPQNGLSFTKSELYESVVSETEKQILRMRMNKAQLEANTTFKAKHEKLTKELEAKRDVAVAEAKLQAMEEVFDESDREREVSSQSLTEQRTAKYIIEQSKLANRQYKVHNSAPAVNNIDKQTFLHNEENMNEELPIHNSAPVVNNINTQTLLRNK
ncbi:unnamed protein product [Mytilus edulis]|uniref:Uncharacterized protein n=1 Tax=Mytilus edulis TaxID=6550 RepID=A0A8S3V4S4_MYTED|nr:unnamed protein product [Mytilus edulis]